MKPLESIFDLLQKDCFMANIYLKDTYNTVPRITTNEYQEYFKGVSKIFSFLLTRAF